MESLRVPKQLFGVCRNNRLHMNKIIPHNNIRLNQQCRIFKTVSHCFKGVGKTPKQVWTWKFLQLPSILSRLRGGVPGLIARNNKRTCFHAHGIPGAAANTGVKENPVSHWVIVKKMLTYVWPKDNPAIRVRVVAAVFLLIGSKLLNISVPFLFKRAVDDINSITGSKLSVEDPEATVLTFVFALLVGYGIARAGASGFNELRNVVFGKVAQSSIRRVSRNVFLHLHNLDMSFHLARQTGGLSKAIDRGSRAINFVLSALVFNVVPLILEVSLVSSLLWWNCGGKYALVTVGCVGAYAVLTLRFHIIYQNIKFLA